MAMGILRHVMLLLSFVLCFFIVGVPHWLLAYSEISLPDTMMNAGLLVVASTALALRAAGVASVRRIVLVVGAAAPTAIMVRVNVDVAADPTSHNLWPFEVAIALGVGLAVALAGALAGVAVARLVAARTAGGEP